MELHKAKTTLSDTFDWTSQKGESICISSESFVINWIAQRYLLGVLKHYITVSEY